MESPDCLHLFRPSCLLISALLGFSSQALLAGTKPQVDLSLSVELSPEAFVPGSRTRVELTLHNAGPDTAGTIPPQPYRNFVVGDPFDITTSPPLFEVVEVVGGCAVERFVSEPFLDGRIELAFVYYFNAIPANQSRTCIFEIVFDSTAITSFPGGFMAYANTNDSDWNPANNRLAYTYVAASVAQPVVPVPALSALGLMTLLSGLVVVAKWRVSVAAS